MYTRLLRVVVVILLVAGIAPAANAQHDQIFRNLFNQILGSIQNNEGVFNPFGAEVDTVNSALVPSLNLLLADNISSFPLTSSISVNDYVIRVRPGAPDGEFVSRREPLGPIYAETARTIGRGNIDIGWNASAFRFSQLRGRSLDEIVFSFTPRNLGDRGDEPVRGDIPSEQERLDVRTEIDASVQLFVALATVGVTSQLDVGVAVPVIRLTTEVGAHAVLSQNSDIAFYFFNDDALNPELERTISSDVGSTVGLGDVSLRLKYRLPGSVLASSGMGAALLLDVRLPTGEPSRFMGTGRTNARLQAIVSHTADRLSTHANVGYYHRGAEHDSPEITVNAGVDWKLANPLDVLVDVLGQFELTRNARLASLSEPEGVVFDDVLRSNIPERSRDHRLLLAVGLKYAPSIRVSLLANILVPQGDGGLTYPIAPTVGAFVNF